MSNVHIRTASSEMPLSFVLETPQMSSFISYINTLRWEPGFVFPSSQYIQLFELCIVYSSDAVNHTNLS